MIEDSRSTQGRVLVKDGKWTVPEAERPSNWRQLLPEAPIVRVESAPIEPDEIIPPKESPKEQVIQRIETVITHTETHTETRIEVRAETVAQQTPADPKCELWNSPLWKTIKKAVEESGRVFCGPNDRRGLVKAGLVLCAGLWTRDVRIISAMTGVYNPMLYIERCYKYELWTKDGGVVLGDFDQSCGDLEFWLNSMAVNGDIIRLPNGSFTCSIESPARISS